MTNRARGIVRAGGAAGVAGGLSLTGYAIIQAMQAPGCIAEECMGRPYRTAGPVEGALFLVATVLIIGATLAFLAIPAAAGTRALRTSAVVAATASFSGFALIGIAYFAGLALVLGVIVAYAVMGFSLASSRALPVWAGAMLAVAALLLFGANDQNERVLFVVPFGVAWMVLGALLWASAGGQARMDAERHGWAGSTRPDP